MLEFFVFFIVLILVLGAAVAFVFYGISVALYVGTWVLLFFILEVLNVFIGNIIPDWILAIIAAFITLKVLKH